MSTLVSLAVIASGVFAFVAGDRILVSPHPLFSPAWFRAHRVSLAGIAFFIIALIAWVFVGDTPAWRDGLNP